MVIGEEKLAEISSVIRRKVTLEITFKNRVDVMRDPNAYVLEGDISIPHAAFSNNGEGPSFILSDEWTLGVWEPAVGAPVNEVNVILFHTALAPGKALKESIWIPVSLVRSIKEFGETTFCE